MWSSAWWYDNEGHVFSVTRNLTLQPATAKDCPDPDCKAHTVTGGFPSESFAHRVMEERNAASSSH